jgi:hypothetical protein
MGGFDKYFPSEQFSLFLCEFGANKNGKYSDKFKIPHNWQKMPITSDLCKKNKVKSDDPYASLLQKTVQFSHQMPNFIE